MQNFLENHQLIWYAIAGLSLVIELGIMGLSGPLLFFAIASAVTGILVNIGLINGWPSEILVVGILSAVITLILWKPLKKMQQLSSKTDESSDMIGLKVPASSEITATAGTIRYSGVDWQARLADDIDGEVISEAISDKSQCVIVAVSGTTMLVKAL
ncbi:NfeD family protein [Colwellia sp. E2M01]|uniref:NfeD family protein n=1 Tax=Colwellia sp. E2M01 TaxID=2841561 RepID=UPI001C0827DE|nr:NfeD family protein [Colwellia sp. E2M01]MBU2871892.1 NfeD family protein [Colwellia sp. E2M01]